MGGWERRFLETISSPTLTFFSPSAGAPSAYGRKTVKTDGKSSGSSRTFGMSPTCTFKFSSPVHYTVHTFGTQIPSV